MGRRSSVIVWVLMFAGAIRFEGSAQAQVPLALDQPDAARTYQRIWETIDPDLWEAVEELRSTGAWRPDRPAAKKVASCENDIERLIDATLVEPRSMEADAEEGWSLALTESRNYRRTATALSVDAVRVLSEGRADDAASRVAAILRLARQLAREPRVAATALATTCIELAEEHVENICRDPALTEAGRRLLTAAVAALDEEDPSGYLVGLSGYRTLNEWIGQQFQGPDAGETLVESLPIPADRKRPLLVGEQERWEGRRGRERRGMWPSRELITELRDLDGAAISSAVRLYERMFEDAEHAWHDPDAVDRLQIIDIDAQRNVYGPLARLSPPSFARQRRLADRIDESMARIRLALLAR